MNRVWNTHTQINTKMQNKHEHSHTFVPIAPGGKAGLMPGSSSVPGAGGSVSLSSSISISTSIISSSLSGRGGGGGGESGGSGGGGGAQGGGGGLSGRGGWDGDQREDVPGWGGVVGAKEWVSLSIKSIYIYNTVVLATVKIEETDLWLQPQTWVFLCQTGRASVSRYPGCSLYPRNCPPWLETPTGKPRSDRSHRNIACAL